MPVVCCSAASDGYEGQQLDVGEGDACDHCLFCRVQIEKAHDLVRVLLRDI